ncbi:MAG TPA: phosphatidylserine decarboxylase [Terriglobales bacterium]|nr:phosphatidylserine decarboxylase [Terriglobales bacterium]
MVRDGYYYGVVFVAASLVILWVVGPLWAWPPLLLAAFFLWFFRDPERQIPQTAGAVVSPADGLVTQVGQIEQDGVAWLRISIFLNVFNVHVNRSPIAGVITNVKYREGKFQNAMGAACADENEQNIVTVEGEGQRLVFKQIAGLLARRIVFSKSVGDRVARGERVGMIKFGSRTDVLMNPAAALQVKVGDHVKGGSSVLAYLHTESQLATVGSARTTQGVT